MKTKQDKLPSMGVIIGRFQIDRLHQAHKDLIDYVCSNHARTVILIGSSVTPGSRENPLSYEARKQMIEEHYPNVLISHVTDKSLDETWSEDVDKEIWSLLNTNQTAILYGGRGSFLPHYSGVFSKQELESLSLEHLSATEIRRSISDGQTERTASFRRGVIFGASDRFPVAYTTVDIAVLNEDETEVLLGRKHGETELRFIGGFVDPQDTSMEAACRREVREECGVEITDPKYVGSTKIDDWRYRRGPDKIKTLLFKAKFMFGTLQAADDIEELRWVKLDSAGGSLIGIHQRLLQMLLANLDQEA